MYQSSSHEVASYMPKCTHNINSSYCDFRFGSSRTAAGELVEVLSWQRGRFRPTTICMVSRETMSCLSRKFGSELVVRVSSHRWNWNPWHGFRANRAVSTRSLSRDSLFLPFRGKGQFQNNTLSAVPGNPAWLDRAEVCPGRRVLQFPLNNDLTVSNTCAHNLSAFELKPGCCFESNWTFLCVAGPGNSY